MTGLPRSWPPEPGDGLWTARDGSRWRAVGGGRLRRAGDDDPAGAQSANAVWDSVGPLIPPSRLAAAYRRHGHELECDRDRAVTAAGHDLLAADADRMFARAEQVQP